MPEYEALLSFFKSLADASRLQIIGLLAHRPHTVEELAEVLGLRASTISHHLARLSESGLVRATVDGHYHRYALDAAAVEERARALLSTDELRELAPGVQAADVYDRKVLETFLDAQGRMTAIPMKRKNFEAILRHALRTWFSDAGPWTEQEVNERLLAMTDDVASIRRGFIDHGLMRRDRGGHAYRRVET